MSPWVWILALGAGTLLIRATFLVGTGNREPSRFVARVLRLVPAAVLPALIVPALFFHENQFDASWQNERLLAGAVAALVAWRIRNVSATLIAGMLVLWLFNALTV